MRQIQLRDVFVRGTFRDKLRKHRVLRADKVSPNSFLSNHVHDALDKYSLQPSYPRTPACSQIFSQHSRRTTSMTISSAWSHDFHTTGHECSLVFDGETFAVIRENVYTDVHMIAGQRGQGAKARVQYPRTVAFSESEK